MLNRIFKTIYTIMSSNYIRTSNKYYLIIKNYANEPKLPKIFKKLVKAHFPVIKKSKTYFTRLNKKKTSILNILLIQKIYPIIYLKITQTSPRYW